MADIDIPQDPPLVVKSPAEQVVEARFKRDIRDVLRDLYHTRRLSQEQIATELGVSRPTVVQWMQRHGIETAYNRAEVAAQ